MWAALLEFLAPFGRPLARLWSNKITKDNSPDEIDKRKREAMGANLLAGNSERESERVNDLVRSLKQSGDRPQ
jgi:hypothetical protein